MYEAIITIVAFLLLLWAGSLHFELKNVKKEANKWRERYIQERLKTNPIPNIND